MPEVTLESDGSQDALLVRVQAGEPVWKLLGYRRCTAVRQYQLDTGLRVRGRLLYRSPVFGG